MIKTQCAAYTSARAARHYRELVSFSTRSFAVSGFIPPAIHTIKQACLADARKSGLKLTAVATSPPLSLYLARDARARGVRDHDDNTYYTAAPSSGRDIDYYRLITKVNGALQGRALVPTFRAAIYQVIYHMTRRKDFI